MRPHFFFLISGGTWLADSGRSRTWPKLDFTEYRSPRNRSRVRALVGDSTITRVFAIVPLHPNTFCQSERSARRRSAAPAPPVPARRVAGEAGVSAARIARKSRRDRTLRLAPDSRAQRP